MPEMTPLEAAEKLEYKAELFPGMADLLLYAASLCRKIASGEYAPVVHAKWIKGYVCNNCFHHNAEGMTPICPYCGALMDGKKMRG